MTLVENTKTFLRETSVEIKKVSWPTRTELQESTLLVILAVCVMMVLVFFVDRAFSYAVELILG